MVLKTSDERYHKFEGMKAIIPILNKEIPIIKDRALCEVNEDNRPILKKEGLLTRDPRMVERKKFGQKKARKKFQFSKR